MIMLNQPDKLVVGSRRTLKYLKLGKISKVFMAKNAPEDVKSDIEYYARISNVDVIVLDLDNEELGAALKKSFKVSVVSVLK
ncbi:MAG TPA: 50S ribosomal protein L30 [Candidatus Nanopusillus sp.]|nr:50S ribosomal protein L30 [Hydrogenothermaceae bacterium]HIP66659.1 50S ribosomal protein L30 [Candidatus Nanopusillus sp.]HIP90521.1 50S ribosomal protein L30 [Candidatus Nanopusillus sp.]